MRGNMCVKGVAACVKEKKRERERVGTGFRVRVKVCVCVWMWVKVCKWECVKCESESKSEVVWVRVNVNVCVCLNVSEWMGVSMLVLLVKRERTGVRVSESGWLCIWVCLWQKKRDVCVSACVRVGECVCMWER
jgi:hypothetical protein